MSGQLVNQIVVSAQPTIDSNQKTEKAALFNADGTPFTVTNLPTATPVVTGTAIDTAAKTTTSPEPAANTIVMIQFTNGNSAASPTVAFDGGTARAVNLGGSAPGAGEITLAAGGVAMFWFDGTILHQIGVYS